MSKKCTISYKKTIEKHLHVTVVAGFKTAPINSTQKDSNKNQQTKTVTQNLLSTR